MANRLTRALAATSRHPDPVIARMGETLRSHVALARSTVTGIDPLAGYLRFLDGSDGHCAMTTLDPSSFNAQLRGMSAFHEVAIRLEVLCEALAVHGIHVED